MRIKAQPRTQDVERIKGQRHLELAERCFDERVSLPTIPCTNEECSWWIRGEPYLNCSFVVFEAVGQTAKKLSLEEIGEMEGITREGVRQIEKRAINKIRTRVLGGTPDQAPGAVAVLQQPLELPAGW